MSDLVKRLRDLRERFIFQGGSEFAVNLADRIEELERDLEAMESSAAQHKEWWHELQHENAALKAANEKLQAGKLVIDELQSHIVVGKAGQSADDAIDAAKGKT